MKKNQKAVDPLAKISRNGGKNGIPPTMIDAHSIQKEGQIRQNGGAVKADAGRILEPICILGMHRCGTSLTTSVLQQLGFSQSDPEKLLPPNQFNPEGYWENSVLTAMNDEILKRLGGSWHEPPVMTRGWEQSTELFDLRAKAEGLLAEEFGGRPDWVWKDPRISLTLPFWLPFLPPETRFVICYRNPAEVCRSLQERDGFLPLKGSFLWQHYLVSAIVATAGRPRFFMRFEGWFDPNDSEIDRLAHFAANMKIEGQTQTKIRSYLKESLRHHQSSNRFAMDESQVDFSAKWLYELFCAGNFADRLAQDDALMNRCRSLLASNQGRLLTETKLSVSANELAAMRTEHEAQLAAMRAEKEALGRMVQVRNEKIAEKSGCMAEMQNTLNQKIAERDTRIAEMQKNLLMRLSEKDGRIAEMQKNLFESQLATATQNRMVQAQNEKVTEKEGMLAEAQKNRQASEVREEALKQRVSTQEQQIRQLTTMNRHFDARLAHLRARLAALHGTKLFRYTRGVRRLWRALKEIGKPAVRSAASERDELWSNPPILTVKRTAVRLRLRQIYFEREHRSKLLKGAIGYFNPKANRYLESQVIRDLVLQGDHKDCDYYGVLSWSFGTETGLNYGSIFDAIENDRLRSSVYSFFSMHNVRYPGNVWLQGVEFWYPPLFLEIGKKLFEKLGITADITSLPTTAIFSNHWIAERAVYEQFVLEMLVPAMGLLESDEELRTLCEKDSGYFELCARPDEDRFGQYPRSVSPEKCQALFGVPYYTFHPFICERLISTWLALHPEFRVTHLE